MKLLKLALHDLRGGIGGLRIFVLCVVLGVTVMAATGLLRQSMLDGIARDAKAILGADIALEEVHQPIPQEAQQLLAEYGQVSMLAELRSMAGFGDDFALIQLKGVTPEDYPFYGELRTEPQIDRLDDAGALVAPELAERLGADIGDNITIGEMDFTLRGIIRHEPDALTTRFALGPKVIVTMEGLKRAGFLKPGTLITYRSLVKLDDPDAGGELQKALEERFPAASWRLRTYENAGGGVRRVLDRLNVFLAFCGLTALIAGGFGVAQACQRYLQRKQATMALLKCLGGSRQEVARIYGLQLGIVGGASVAAGLALACLIIWALLHFLGDALPVPAAFSISPFPLALAAAMAAVVLILFARPALLSGTEISPASLLRSYRLPPPPIWSLRVFKESLPAILMLVFLGVFASGDLVLTLWFAAGVAGALLLFRGLAILLERLAEKLAARTKKAGTRLALANLYRPGNSTPAMMIAMGLGIALVASMTGVASSLYEELSSGLPEDAPTVFLLDIQPYQTEPLQQMLGDYGGIENLQLEPMLRGRVVELNGAAPSEAQRSGESSWLLRRDIGLSEQASPLPHQQPVEGEWWPEDYRGTPLVSFGEEYARELGLSIGDSITVEILGQRITAEIANLREIDWTSLRMNFVGVFSPGSFDALPRTYLATLRAEEAREVPLLKRLSEEFPTVSAIRIRDAAATFQALLEKLTLAVLLAAGITLLSGILVVAGAMAATLDRRIYDTVVLKVLGLTRRQLVGMYVLEFTAVAGAVALAALLVGVIAAMGIISLMPLVSYHANPVLLGWTLVASIVLLVGIGLVTTWRALGEKPLGILRNE